MVVYPEFPQEAIHSSAFSVLQDQLKQQVFTSALAFFVGTGLGVIVQATWGEALKTGLVAIPVGYVCAAAGEVQRFRGERSQRQTLRQQIVTLREQHNQLRQGINAALQTQQQVEGNLQALVQERDRLLHRITQLNQQHHLSMIQRPLSEPTSATLPYSNGHTQTPPDWDAAIAQKQTQADQLDRHLHRLENAVEMTQTRILDQQEVYEQIQQEVAQLQEQKEAVNLQTQKVRVTLNTLLQSQERLKNSLEELQQQHQETIAEVQRQQNELESLYTQVEGRQQTLQTLQADYQTLQCEYDQLENQVHQKHQELAIAQTELQDRQAQIEAIATDPQPESHFYALSSEWLDFIQVLSIPEKLALQAIIQDDEVAFQHALAQTSGSLQDCLDALNTAAIATLGDALVEGQDGQLIPYVNEDFATILAAAIAIPFHELLHLASAVSRNEPAPTTNGVHR